MGINSGRARVEVKPGMKVVRGNKTVGRVSFVDIDGKILVRAEPIPTLARNWYTPREFEAEGYSVEIDSEFGT